MIITERGERAGDRFRKGGKLVRCGGGVGGGWGGPYTNEILGRRKKTGSPLFVRIEGGKSVRRRVRPQRGE